MDTETSESQDTSGTLTIHDGKLGNVDNWFDPRPCAFSNARDKMILNTEAQQTARPAAQILPLEPEELFLVGGVESD